jgi:hypothetical protein
MAQQGPPLSEAQRRIMHEYGVAPLGGAAERARGTRIRSLVMKKLSTRQRQPEPGGMARAAAADALARATPRSGT